MISDDDFIFLVYESRNARTILEIGTGTGKSTAALSTNGSLIMTIDRNDIFTFKGLKYAKRHIMESKDFWYNPHMQYNLLYDFVFIDASIGLGDCEEILKRTTDNFSVAFHDYLPGNKNKNENKGEYNMKCFKEAALENYNITQRTGGSHCAILDLNKDK